MGTAQALHVPFDPGSEFLSTLTADARHRRLAGGALLVSVLIFLAVAPFARTALPQVPAFIPLYQSALITNDVITAVLLLGQFSFLRARALLVLAAGYLFCACMAIAHGLSFPGLFAPGGVLGGGGQTTAWLYFLWHGGFPLFVLAYCRLKKDMHARAGGAMLAAQSPRREVLWAIGGAIGLSLLVVLLTTLGHDNLPVIMRGNRDDPRKLLVASCTWIISLSVLVHLWRRRVHSVVDLWLMVSLTAWLFDIALAAVLNGARFDLGFYGGRVYGLLASSFVLIVLLLENWRLYADVTSANLRERQRNAELVQARNEAHAATQAKSDFLAAMSHEIRTPMNGVIGIADVLARSSLKTDQVAMVDLIRESAFSLLSIIDDILDFSKIEAGRLEIENQPMAVADVVEKVCAMLNRLAEKQKVELTLFTDPKLPDDVLGDALRLRQVLINLINNAIKFSGGAHANGKVAVRALLASRDSERVVIEFQVIDNGIGMSEATLSGLFAAFSQADASTTRRFGGTGLGLAISRNLAQLMGGTIAVNSTVGVGSTFTLRLPFAATPASESRTSAVLPVAGLSCLVIGDCPGVPYDLQAYLLDAGVHTRLAPDVMVVREWVPALTQGLWIWVVGMCPDMPGSLDGLRAIARSKPSLDIRFLVIGRGPIRYPQRIEADCVSVDGNVLTRGALLRAVAVAAGRMQAEETQLEAVLPHTAPLRAPLSREEARRQRRLILVVEDNDINQKVIMQQLALLGHTADLVGDGLQALDGWRSGDYAVVVTDLHMPGMDGYQLTSAIRAQELERADSARLAETPLVPRVPIIALTANALKSEVQRCKAAGMDDFLCKPMPLAELQAVLDKWLPGAGQDGAVPHGAAPANAPVAASAGVAAPTTPVDIAVLQDLIGDDPDDLVDFLQAFRISARRAAQAMEQACQEGNAAELVAQAHKLTAAARSVGALALGEVCAAMEQEGSTAGIHALTARFEQFTMEMAAVDSHLAAILPLVTREGKP